MSKIRIVFTLPSLIGGGAERVTLNIVKELDRDRFEPVFLLGEAKGALLSEVPSDVAVHAVGSDSIKGAIPGLIRKIWKLKPDLIYGTLGFGWGLASVRNLLPRRTKLVCRLGNTLSAFLSDIERHSESRAMAMRVLNRVGYERAEITVCQSDFMVEDACRELEVDGRRFRRIYNPVDLTTIRQAAGEPLTDAPGRFVVSVGNLHWRKGYDLLIQAWNELNEAGLHLVILGEGDQRERLEQMIASAGLENRIHLRGYDPNPYRWVSRAEFFVSPSRYEGFANVILESLALGTPVVATDCPSGNRELMSAGTGTLVPLNVEGLRAGLRDGIDSAQDWRSLSSDWNIEERFSAKSIIRSWEGLFLTTLGSR